MTSEKFLTYRGEIRAIGGVGSTLVFVTEHPEGQPGALYRLDPEKWTLTTTVLPGGGLALAAEGESLWIGGGDGFLYQVGAGGAKPLGPKWESPVKAIVPLADHRLAALVDRKLVILSRKDGKTLQTFELADPGTCLAADPTGRWLAAGTHSGTVSLFDVEAKDEFLLSASGKLHEGAVTALLFEPDDLRFFSTGADRKLLSTHARGRLEPEDKSRSNNHTDLVAALIWGPGERLYSGSLDGTIKSWPRAGGVKPATIKEGVARVTALALVTVLDRPRLVVACDDNTLRFFPIDAGGKIGELADRIHDAYARARQELNQAESPRREAALQELAGFGDSRSVEIIDQQIGLDPDHTLRLMATQILAGSDHPQAATRLESCLKYRDEAVRVAAFHGLRRHAGASSLRPIDLALKADQADIGKLAVEALEPLAAKDDQALSRLTNALDARTPDVRMAALVALESAYGPKSPEANLIALGSKHADVRRGALIRLDRRQLLDDPAVPSALRRSADDPDPGLRQVAFLLALQTRPRLLQALRARDPELQRQLLDLAGTTAEPAKPEKVKGKAATSSPLDETDLEPLLQASAARSLDTCLRGARGLAILGDPRAFGLLLQLSREEDTGARAEVCRAMAALDDPRALERLRSLLHDKEPEVRDAAFTALVRIHEAEPLVAAESGLNATHEETRRRGLQTLVAVARKPSGGDAARTLLARVLNDSFPSVRAEAFKSALSLQIGGPGAGTLRFASKSLHADVRREVLNEVMAQIAESWGFDLLLEFFNDPDPALRGDAFALALKKTRGLEFLEAALGSRYADLRLKSVEGLIKKHTTAAQLLLVRALDDEDKVVRLAALAALVDLDAVPALTQALGNVHPDVRLRAAKSLAIHGDPKALAPLMALVTAPEPEEKERQSDWLNLVESAVEGLGELGDPAALPALIPALDSPHGALRREAALALARVSPIDRLDPLRQALQHADPEVKYRAAYGLACLGDDSVASLVFSEAGGRIISVGGQIAAALALGSAGEGRLVVFLDDPKDEVRARVLLLLMMKEWKDSQGSASLMIACLSSRTPRLRLTAARGLEALADPASFARFVVDLVNDQGDKPAWKIPEATIDALAEMLIHGGPNLQVRTARLLRLLDMETQQPFDQSWKVHESRFAAELAKLQTLAKQRKPVPLKYDASQLQDLAFGAYVGLVREQAAPKTKGQGGGADPQAVKVRQSALAHLLKLTELDRRHGRAALPVFIQALGDPNQVVRTQAFEQAQVLGISPTRLAAEALASGHVDLGVRGLELLTGGANEVDGQAVLEQAMLTRKDDLAIEAARLLMARLGTAIVGGRALEAANEKLRREAIAWLAAESDTDPKALVPLRQALESRYAAIRELAAFALATKKDPASFDALVSLLKAATDPKAQRRIVQAIETLGDPRGPAALLDRVIDDPAGTALADELIRAAGRFRSVDPVDRLFALLEKDPKKREAAFSSLLMISGYDQEIVDPNDEANDDRWWREQHPRVDELLARLIDRFSAPGEARFLARLLPGARWSRSKVVDPLLAPLVNHPDEFDRHEAVKALGWRLRKRGGESEPLRLALGHRDPTTQFLAAEGLALAGHADGLNVLMASIDFATDLDVRRRSILALGELGDERAFETLLKLAGEEGHALQESAAEAIGHMGRSPRAADVFQLLERQAKGDTGVALAALKGLRWLGTGAAWQLIRTQAADDHLPFRNVAIELLGFDDDPATRDLLLKLITTLHPWQSHGAHDVAFKSARRVFGPDSLEPDYAAFQNDQVRMFEDRDTIIARVQERGEPSRIFAILPRCPADIRAGLRDCLLNRPELPIAEAKQAITSPDATTAAIAAQVLGRSGRKAADLATTLETALVHWQTAWEQLRSGFVGGIRILQNDHNLATKLTLCLQSLVWAGGRLGISRKVLAGIAAHRVDDPQFRLIRREAVLALTAAGSGDGVFEALEAAALVGDPETRAIAAQAVGQLDPKQAESLADRLLSDAGSFRRITLDGKVRVDDAIRSAAGNVHAQGVVLPALIAAQDVATLGKIAQDRTGSEAVRLGSLEGLAALGLESAESILIEVGSDEKEDDEIRKSAWRLLRRSRRARAKTRPGIAKVKS